MKALRHCETIETGGRRQGFTLLELIVVITIIGLLGTMVAVKVTGILGGAQETKVREDLRTIIRGAEMFKAMEGYYPETLEELTTNERVSIELYDDPWGNPYEYEIDSNGKPRAHCWGKDGEPGGENENQDYHEPEEAEGF